MTARIQEIEAMTDESKECEALAFALNALDEIALAGMSGTGMESEEAMRDWHARRAWEFIGIAARAKDEVRGMLAARPQAPTAPAGVNERDVLWCVNVHGPDDVYAMPNKAAALEHANELNIYFGKLTNESATHEYDPIMRAVVIEWPHSAESHAADLAAQVARKED
jgi:hypothetical protein